MCRHTWTTIYSLRVCPKCGLTVSLIDGKMTHDKKLPAIVSRKRGKNK